MNWGNKWGVRKYITRLKTDKLITKGLLHFLETILLFIIVFECPLIVAKILYHLFFLLYFTKVLYHLLQYLVQENEGFTAQHITVLLLHC